MPGTYISIPVGGGSSAYFGDPVATAAALPGTGAAGEIRLVQDTGVVYYWNGSAWDPIDASVGPGLYADTDSVDLTLTSGILTADAKISAAAATAGFFKATTTIKSGGTPGLHVEAQLAATAQTGFLSSTDWNTFNNKEPAITAATTADFYRGDKTFQTLQMSALTATTAGTAASTGQVGEILTATQGTLTTTGVGATGVYGSPISVSLTAGSWMVTGVAGFSENGATLTDSFTCGISASAAAPGPGVLDTAIHTYLISGASLTNIVAPVMFVDLNATFSYYLNTRFYYTSGTPQHMGRIRAIRIR